MLALAGILVFCVATLLPSFADKGTLPSWFTSLFAKKINLGLDLQGGMHIVYSIDLEKAVDDRASEIKRDLEARFTDDKIDAVVRQPSNMLGALVVVPKETDPAKLGDIDSKIETYSDSLTKLDCDDSDPKNALCYRVSTKYQDDLKKSALTNAVSTIRERINEKGVAEPSVVEKGDEIIVELPGDPDDPALQETEDIIARTAKLEFKVIDDCGGTAPADGCSAKYPDHNGSEYMKKLYAKVGSDKQNNPTDPGALAAQIHAENEIWKPEEGGGPHKDYYLLAYDRDESIPLAEAKQIGCLRKDSVVVNDMVTCSITGRHVIERYVLGVSDRDGKVLVKGLAQNEPSFKMPDDHQFGFEIVEPPPGAKDPRKYWRTYYLERAVQLTGSAVSNAFGQYDQNTNRPIVIVEFNRFGGRVFGDLTDKIVGMKLATILDDKVKSAPQINQAIRGGRASITMGASDPKVAEQERDDLVNVLKTGSLPAPLHEESSDKEGATLGQDAIDKTKLSFALGILLVVVIMVGVYRWSGWIAVFAVVWHIVMTLAVMALFGATLTLPGIAAIVLSIGMEVDGNILIYERIRDELNLGKSVRGAIDLGFSRAFSAILDGQLTTAAAGWVLLQYGSGPIKGFAVMLLVGVFTTLTTNVWVTRIFFDWTVARKKGSLVTISI
jgi:preprotein translocase subunit SecD|nr:protein translocase subunit SecD [Kofleriaceae bacterium]